MTGGRPGRQDAGGPAALRAAACERGAVRRDNVLEDRREFRARADGGRRLMGALLEVLGGLLAAGVGGALVARACLWVCDARMSGGRARR